LAICVPVFGFHFRQRKALQIKKILSFLRIYYRLFSLFWEIKSQAAAGISVCRMMMTSQFTRLFDSSLKLLFSIEDQIFGHGN